MSTPNEITIGNVEYIRKDSIAETDGEIKIVVLDRGFVYVGLVEMDADFVTIKKARNIRSWGTSKGLGELVSGPLMSTRLDFVGTVKCPSRALISLIDVEQSKWNSI